MKYFFNEDEVEIATLRSAVNMILNHVENDLHIKKLAISPDKSSYWDLDLDGIYKVLDPPPKPVIRYIKDDCEFISSMVKNAGGSGDHPSLMLMHVVPLLSLVCDVVRA